MGDPRVHVLQEKLAEVNQAFVGYRTGSEAERARSHTLEGELRRRISETTFQVRVQPPTHLVAMRRAAASCSG